MGAMSKESHVTATNSLRRMILLLPDTIEWNVSSSTRSRRDVASSTGKVSLSLCVTHRPNPACMIGDAPIPGDFDLDGMCAKELDIDVVVIQKRDDQAPSLVSFLDVEEFLLKATLGV